MACLDVVLLNTGDVPTYERDGRTSIVDLTIVSSSLARQNNKWKVNDVFNLSDEVPRDCRIGCLHTVLPFRRSAAACAPRRPLGRAREFQTFSRTPGLSLHSLSSPPYSCVTYLRFTLSPPSLHSQSSTGKLEGPEKKIKRVRPWLAV